MMQARVSSGVDWLNVKFVWEAGGVGVERTELERCLREGKKYVRLSDNTFAPFDADRVQQLIDREIEVMSAAGKSGKLPLSQVGRIQELLEQADEGVVSAGAKQLFARLSNIDSIKPAKKPKNLKAVLVRIKNKGCRGFASFMKLVRAAYSPTTWVSARLFRLLRFCYCLSRKAKNSHFAR